MVCLLNLSPAISAAPIAPELSPLPLERAHSFSKERHFGHAGLGVKPVPHCLHL